MGIHGIHPAHLTNPHGSERVVGGFRVWCVRTHTHTHTERRAEKRVPVWLVAARLFLAASVASFVHLLCGLVVEEVVWGERCVCEA